MDYRYKAFISYRHQSPDQDIAKKLHTYIENYAIPASLKKSQGMTKMGRVFRDQEELPLSSDLGSDIHEALEQSEWLICICSPRYLQSKWCMEELHYFLELGRRDRILTVLTEGEPDEAFPQPLRYRNTGEGQKEVEPLAADVRGASVSESLKKLQNERLRILAPLLGVRYDDLKQRARQRRTRLIMTAGAALILLLSSFLGYAFHKNGQITAERNDALIAESGWLAQSANEALDSGDKMLSLLLSLEALPENFEDPERPVTDDALEALRSAILSGQGDNSYQPVTELTIPGLESFRGYNNTLLCFSRQTEELITAWNMSTGAETESEIRIDEEPVYLLFGDRVYSVYEDRITFSNGYYNNSSLTQFIEDPPASYVSTGDINYSRQHYTLAESDDDYLLVECTKGTFSGYRFYASAYRDYSWVSSGFEPAEAAPLADSGNFVLAGYINTDPDMPDLLMVTHSYSRNNILRTYSMGYADSNGYHYVHDIDASCEGTLFAGQHGDILYFWNVNDELPAATLEVSTLDGGSAEKIAFSPVDNAAVAILTERGHIFLYDCVMGSILKEYSTGMSNITDFMWNGDGSRLLLTCDDGRARLMDTADGQVVQTLECAFPLESAAYAVPDNCGNSETDNYILLSGGEQIQIYALTQGESSSLVGRNAALITSLSYESQEPDLASLRSRVSLSPDGTSIWCCRENTVYVVDTETMETRAELEDEGKVTLLTLGQRYVLTIAEEGTYNYHFRLYDIQTCELLEQWKPTYPHVFYSRYSDPEDRSEKIGWGVCRLNSDETLLALYGYPVRDPSFFVYDLDSFTLLWQMGMDAGHETDRIFDFAADWTGLIMPTCAFMPSGRLWCHYVYSDDGFDDDGEIHHRAFEIRDATTGTVETVYYLPYETRYFRAELDYGMLLAQDTEGGVHLISAEDGHEIAFAAGNGDIFSYTMGADRVFVTYKRPGVGSWDTGSELLFDGTVFETPVKEMALPMRSDGLFGDRPFIAGDDGIYDAVSGSALMHWTQDQYVVFGATDDGSKLLCFAGYPDADPKSTRDGDVVILRYADAAELRDIALGVLDGRTLTEDQRRKYFLE